MNIVFDKIILLMLCTILFLLSGSTEYFIIPFLSTILVSSLCIYFKKKIIHLLLFIIYTGCCLCYPDLCYFLPLVIYDLSSSIFQYFIFFIFGVLGINTNYLDSYSLIFTIVFCILSFYLKYKTENNGRIIQQYHFALNNSTELTLLEEEKNRNLLENHDYEVNIAMLNERNRISKEIHDHIGHILSRSLIQIGALLTITKNPVITQALMSLKESLSEGMDSIRASIHNMHDESIDLYAAINKLIKDFTFCKIHFEYDITNPPLLKLKYCFIAIVKEALSNIIKHSDATKCNILLREDSCYYQLVIEDNGTISEKTKAIARRVQISNDYVDGMGLQNMMDRVKGFHGNYEIVSEDGFKIIVTILKENNGGFL